MITLTPIQPPAYTLRVCPDSEAGQEQPKFHTAGTLEVDAADSRLAKIVGLIGGLSPADIHDLVNKLHEIGVETLRASRKEGHRLAFSKLIDGWYVVDVRALHARMNRTRST